MSGVYVSFHTSPPHTSFTFYYYYDIIVEPTTLRAFCVRVRMSAYATYTAYEIQYTFWNVPVLYIYVGTYVTCYMWSTRRARVQSRTQADLTLSSSAHRRAHTTHTQMCRARALCYTSTFERCARLCGADKICHMDRGMEIQIHVRTLWERYQGRRCRHTRTTHNATYTKMQRRCQHDERDGRDRIARMRQTEN